MVGTVTNYCVTEIKKLKKEREREGRREGERGIYEQGWKVKIERKREVGEKGRERVERGREREMEMEGEREGGKKKYIESDKQRERGSEKGDMERECVCLGVR